MGYVAYGSLSVIESCDGWISETLRVKGGLETNGVSRSMFECV